MMPSTNSLDACNPAFNATVSASAGSGKTWLLITRIVRLLIDGAEPGNIIALTFTRKAAGEMQIRLNQRLFEMATAEDNELEAILTLIGSPITKETKTVAAGLYESLMHSLHPIRIQTFHSFCQDILSRFPLEADIPPGFDLIEDSSLLEHQAWQTLFNEASLSAKPDDKKASSNIRQNTLSDELDIIMQICNGPDNTQTALNSFLSHRSDWWAFTAHTKDPVAFAREQLAQSFQLDEQTISGEKNPVDPLLSQTNQLNLQIFANFLREIKNKTSEKHADIIDDALSRSDDNVTRFALIRSAFIKKDGEKLIQGRQYNPTLEKKLGPEHASRFIELHDEISDRILQIDEQLKRLLSLKINNAWYYAGHRYVEIYQQLKRQLRLLDFTDLEWKCYELLQHADNAHWVQYKIDQRIDHILIDEFQDTNPTQWHLLSPILDEIAANPEQRPRSVFLVGDEKQSIYSFRRANPALQAQASQWLSDNLNARATPLDFSRRSSSAIINCVNHIFEQDDISSIMTGYTTHDTYLNTLPGQVVLADLFEEDEATEIEPVYFRNPLEQARVLSEKNVRQKEAAYIAEKIWQLKNTPSLITDNGTVRAVEYGDIMILMRNRTHIALYENALKQKGIPYIGSKKGGLLDNLEIQDLICLLNTLITPFNNLALAQVLKSPLFDASDNDLIQLAQCKSPAHWYERLLHLASQADITLSKPLRRAATLLPRWQQLAERLPVHDCLDKIYSQSNLIKRYAAANRDENRQKVTANCQRFLELSLETDNGRYPSITRFLQHLQHLKNYSISPPEEPLSQSTESRVKLMTIHASKGLESPVVFIADCNNSSSNRNAYASLVRWPANKSQPVNFQLQLNKDNTDQVTQKLQQEKLIEQAREELNLLYVALTRAREQLYISGNANNKKQGNSWYKIIARGLTDQTQQETTVDGVNCHVYKHLHYEHSDTIQQNQEANTTETNLTVDERLLRPIELSLINNKDEATFMIAPSLYTDKNADFSSAEVDHQTTGTRDKDSAKWRGIIIHRAIELLCNASSYPATENIINNIHQRLKADVALQNPAYLEYLPSCIEEAAANFNHTELQTVFNPAGKAKTYNEMPLMYLNKNQSVYGIVDRVIKADDSILIIDYKSHQLSETETMQSVAGQFSSQLAYYREGIMQLWPDYSVRSAILFTHYKELVWLD